MTNKTFFESDETAEKYLENRATIAKKVLTGIHPTIFTFGIITPENPMGNKLDKFENSKLQDEFKNYLYDGRYHYTRIKGKYGNSENPWLIYNVSLEDMKRFGIQYDQESFIFGRIEDQKVTYEYWDKKKDSLYSLKDTADMFKTAFENKDFFTSLKSWKFTIPFSVFESSIQQNKLAKIDKITKTILENSITKKKTLKWEWMRRGEINSIMKEGDKG